MKKFVHVAQQSYLKIDSMYQNLFFKQFVIEKLTLYVKIKLKDWARG